MKRRVVIFRIQNQICCVTAWMDTHQSGEFLSQRCHSASLPFGSIAMLPFLSSSRARSARTCVRTNLNSHRNEHEGKERIEEEIYQHENMFKLSFVKYEDATDHWGFSNGSRTSPLREQIAIRIACGLRPRYSPRSVKYSATASRASNRSSEANSPQRSDLKTLRC